MSGNLFNRTTDGTKVEIDDIIRTYTVVNDGVEVPRRFKVVDIDISKPVIYVVNMILSGDKYVWNAVSGKVPVDMNITKPKLHAWIGPPEEERPMFTDKKKEKVKIDIGDTVEILTTRKGWETAEVIGFNFESEDINTIIIKNNKDGGESSLGLTTASAAAEPTFRLISKGSDRSSSNSNARVAMGNQPPNNPSIFEMITKGVTPKKPLDIAGDENFMKKRKNRKSDTCVGGADARLKKSKLVNSFNEEMKSTESVDNGKKFASFKEIMKDVGGLKGSGQNTAITTDEIKYMMKAFVDSIGSLDIKTAGGEITKLSDVVAGVDEDDENMDEAISAILNLGEIAEAPPQSQPPQTIKAKIGLETAIDIPWTDIAAFKAAVLEDFKTPGHWHIIYIQDKDSNWAELVAAKQLAAAGAFKKPGEIVHLSSSPTSVMNGGGISKKEKRTLGKTGGARRRRFTIRRGRGR